MSLFPASVRHAALMRESFVGADGVRIALCAGGCGKHIARLSASGAWNSLRYFEFDHRDEKAHGGANTLDNCDPLCAGVEEPPTCHAVKTAEFQTLNAMAGRTGQYARRKARAAKGERPLIPQNKNAWGKRNG